MAMALRVRSLLTRGGEACEVRVHVGYFVYAHTSHVNGLQGAEDRTRYFVMLTLDVGCGGSGLNG
jgi:hypothetical protein